ncbi:MAG: hypothetical protein ACTHKG_04855, partial [Nocardioides sp.]
MGSRPRVRAVLAGLLTLVAACTSAGPSAEAPRTGTTSASASAFPGPGTTSVDPEADGISEPAGPTASPTSRPRPVSIPALFDKAYDGRGL